ncbi:MAG: hypothetical protein LAO21_13150 [Acidobacteriia bacterium]|nr:hypothetical protein [Terriglobia bacterium]
MDEKRAASFVVPCPCCGARLDVDPQLGKVIGHVTPPKKAATVDLDRAAELLKAEEARRDALFNQSAEEMKTHAQLLERKFAAALEKTKDEPNVKPIRDIDLD